MTDLESTLTLESTRERRNAVVLLEKIAQTGSETRSVGITVLVALSKIIEHRKKFSLFCFTLPLLCDERVAILQ